MKSGEINSLFKNLSRVIKNPKSDLKYKNKFTPTPMHKEKPSNGSKYFLFGSSILQKGIKKIKTMAILIAPNNIGGIEALRPSFAVG